MLGQIANYCPIISRNTIVKNSTSLEDIWQAIKLHFGLQHTGAHFLDFAEMRQEPVEKPEDLYQRLVAFVDDNLLTQGSVITHHGESQTEEEDITPTVENFIVLTWLRLIHPELPRLVKQRYGPELRSRTFATIKPEISQALHSLVDKLRTSEDAGVLRTAASQFRPSRQFSSNRTSHKPKEKFTCECPLCQQTKRPRTDHFLSTCPFLSERDKKYMLHARLVTGVDDLGLEESYSDDEDNALALPDSGEHGVASVLRVMITESPHINMYHGHVPVQVTLDSAATGNLINSLTAKSIKAHIKPTTQGAHKADGNSPLHVVSETHITLTMGDKQFQFEGLVVDNLDGKIFWVEYHLWPKTTYQYDLRGMKSNLMMNLP